MMSTPTGRGAGGMTTARTLGRVLAAATFWLGGEDREWETRGLKGFFNLL